MSDINLHAYSTNNIKDLPKGTVGELDNFWYRKKETDNAVTKLVEHIEDIEVELSMHKGIFQKHIDDMTTIVDKIMWRDAKRVKKLEDFIDELERDSDLSSLSDWRKGIATQEREAEEQDNG